MWVEVRDRSGLRSGSVVDFRVVDKCVVDIKLHMDELTTIGLLVIETLEEPLYVSSPLGIRARIGMICHGCELEISGTLLTVDLRIMDMSEFDVILRMDWLTAYRVVIECENRRLLPTRRTVLVWYFRETSMTFYPK